MYFIECNFILNWLFLLIYYVDSLDVFFFKGICDRWGFNERLGLDVILNGDVK